MPDMPFDVTNNTATPTPTAAAPGTTKYWLIPVIGIVMLALGVGAGFGISAFMPNRSVPLPVVKKDELVLPADAVQIQRCADHKGTLYIESKNIPVGPVYMVHNNKVIGIEYMLAKDEFLTGKSYLDLLGLGLKVDHVNIGLLSQGHEGYTVAHYHFDLYSVSRADEQSIVCQPSSSASASSSASESAMPMDMNMNMNMSPATPSASVTATPAKGR